MFDNKVRPHDIIVQPIEENQFRIKNLPELEYYRNNKNKMKRICWPNKKNEITFNFEISQ